MALNETPGLNSGRLYRRLLGYARPHWRLFAASLLAMVVVAATETGFAAIMKPLLDGNFIERDPNTIRLIPVALVLLFLLRGIAAFVTRYGMAAIGRRVIARLRSELFDKLLRLPMAHFDTTPAGRLLSRLTFDVEQVAEASTTALTVLVRDSLTLLFLLGWMFWISGWLTLLFLLVGPVLVALIRYVSRRFRRISRRIQESMGELTQFSEEILHGQRLIRSFNAADWLRQRFLGVNERNRRLQLRHAAVAGAATPVVQFITACILAVVVYLTTLEAVTREISVGSFVSFITAMLLLMPPMKRLTNINASVQRGLAAARSVFGLLDSAEEKDTDDARPPSAELRGDIRFEQVSFGYRPGKPVLRGLDLRIRAGETVALVGPSGAGKSTLVELLLRFREPDGGCIRLDGYDIRDLPLAHLREQIALVGQDPVLFNDSVRNNIAFGSLAGRDEKAIIEAARKAHAWAFIQALPQGLDTRIGDRGSLLSGGQRQRLALARAILKNAPILVLDEATSALDSESERMVQEAMSELMQRCTALVIAHRLSTVEQADRILVLEAGQIVEEGSHAGLLAANGRYARLYRLHTGSHD